MLSLDPDASNRLSELSAKDQTALLCPSRVLRHFPLGTSHRRIVLSPDPDASNRLSELSAKDQTDSVCASITRTPVSSLLLPVRSFDSSKRGLTGWCEAVSGTVLDLSSAVPCSASSGRHVSNSRGYSASRTPATSRQSSHRNCARVIGNLQSSRRRGMKRRSRLFGSRKMNEFCSNAPHSDAKKFSLQSSNSTRDRSSPLLTLSGMLSPSLMTHSSSQTRIPSARSRSASARTTGLSFELCERKTS